MDNERQCYDAHVFCVSSRCILLSFPLSLDSNWQTVAELPNLFSDVSEPLRSWLLEANSLTARLRQSCGDLRVEVLSEQLAKPSTSESSLFSVPSEVMWCREVILWCDERPVVYAQSWIPESLQNMTKLGTMPLGEVLFQHPKWQRGELQVARIEAPLKPLISQLEYVAMEGKMARRSVFSQQGVEILVCEVFLTEPFEQ